MNHWGERLPLHQPQHSFRGDGLAPRTMLPSWTKQERLAVNAWASCTAQTMPKERAVCDLICVTTLKWQKDRDGEEWWSAPKTVGRGGSKNSVREAVTMRKYCQFWTKWWLQKCSRGKGTHIVQCQVPYSSVVLGRTWEVLGTFLCSLWNFHGLYHSKTLKIT